MRGGTQAPSFLRACLTPLTGEQVEAQAAGDRRRFRQANLYLIAKLMHNTRPLAD